MKKKHNMYFQSSSICVWYFNFACFNMTAVKILMKNFSRCLCSFSTSQFFCSGNLFQKNDRRLSKIQFLCSSLVFLSLNNPSQGQYISVREFSGSSILLNQKIWKNDMICKIFQFHKITSKIYPQQLF